MVSFTGGFFDTGWVVGTLKINTGFSGSNIMGEERPQRETSKTRTEDETETSGCEGKQNGILGQYKGVIVLILVG
jgi:hypothetical protein